MLKEAGYKLVVVDFCATWAGACKIVAPKIEAMSKEFIDVVFLKMDVGETLDIFSMYNILATPTFLYFKNGSKVAAYSGATEGPVRELIIKYM